MKNSVLKSALVAMTLGCAATVNANPRAAVMIGYPDVASIENAQEKAAAEHFTAVHPDGGVIAPGETSKINHADYDCIWIHIDRLNVGHGNLPAEFADDATLEALKQFVADGGCLLMTKQATQMVHRIGRIDAAFAPGIYGDGDGGAGTDVWTVNAQIGYCNAEADPSQFYDRRNHEIYAGLRTNNDFACETYALEGTGDGSEMHREDHNCCWDLNAYNAIYTAEGRNTVEKFEAQNNAVVLGTWGHVVDYAVAGIIEFLPASENAGRIIANGLAACEWAPRNGGNAFHENLEKLTDNCIGYLASKAVVAIDEISAEDTTAPVEYFNLQGMAVGADALTPGIYVTRQGAKVAKVIVK